jgi:hypothetical protein
VKPRVIPPPRVQPVALGALALFLVGCTSMLRADLGYTGTLTGPSNRQGAVVAVGVAYESIVGVEGGARATIGDGYYAVGAYGGLLASNYEDPVRFVLRVGLNVFQAEWLEGVPTFGGASPLAEVGLRIQLTGPPHERRPGLYLGDELAAQGLFLGLAAGLQYYVRAGVPGEGFGFVTAGLGYAFGGREFGDRTGDEAPP